MEIRAELPEDLEAVRDINRAAFGRDGEADLVDALRRAPVPTLSFVALEDGRLVGHILFSPVSLEPDAPAIKVAGLAPMAVLPGWQRNGVGSALVRHGLEACRREGYDALVVLGHPDYYPRFGFEPASRWGLRSEYMVPDEVFMARELNPGALNNVSGLVRYQPEFAGV